MNLPKREEGQGLVEYALLLVLVAVIIIAILTILGSQVMVVFAKVTAGLNGQVVTGVGKEAVITGYDANVTSGFSCRATITDVSFVGLEDGALLKDSTVPIYFKMGENLGSATGTTGSDGTGTFSGSITIDGPPCSVTPGK